MKKTYILIISFIVAVMTSCGLEDKPGSEAEITLAQGQKIALSIAAKGEIAEIRFNSTPK